MLDLADIRLQRSRWNFAQLEEWWRYLTPRIFGAGAHMADVDEAHNRVAFEFATDSARRAARALLDTLGVPCGLVELRVGSRAQLSPRDAQRPANPRRERQVRTGYAGPLP